LLAELEELEQQDLEEKLLDVGPTVELPSVPSAVPSEPSRGSCGYVEINYVLSSTLLVQWVAEVHHNNGSCAHSRMLRGALSRR